ncbi:MAG: transcriptional regulator NrdR [Candidatus Poribacteria bacterium]|nr:transcriptional regulator NrdR [Candidatus Poribacteria bacterium]
MKCPYCSGLGTRVIDKRDTDTGSVIRRRRECLQCEKRFTTYERAEVLDLFVIKKDQRREAFDRRKLRRNMMKACEKRPISQETIDRLIGLIEQQLINMRKSEIESRAIGELVMDALKGLDKVAYIRFASVYRDFTDVADFEEELRQLAHNTEVDETACANRT